MRILLLTDLYAPIIGGLEGHVRTLGLELSSRGHDVAVATMRQEGTPRFEIRDGLRVYRLNGWSSNRRLSADPGRRFHPPFPDPGAVAELNRVCDIEAPDIVHAHSWILFSALAALKRRSVPVVATLHDYGLVCPKKTFMHEGKPCSGPGLVKCMGSAREQYGLLKAIPLTAGLRLSWRAQSRVERFIAVSRAVADAVIPVVGSRVVDVIPNFVEDALLATQTEPLPSPLGRSIVFVGALGRYKGLHVLIDAWLGMPKPRPPLLLIGTRVGDTPRDWAPGVEVRENVPHDQVMAALRQARVAVVPSIWPEPCPTVAMEALAAGTPVVATAVGGLPDIVDHGETGLLVAPNDAHALRAALQRLIENDELCGAMGERARKEAVRFAASNAVPQIERVYVGAQEAAFGRRGTEAPPG